MSGTGINRGGIEDGARRKLKSQATGNERSSGDGNSSTSPLQGSSTQRESNNSSKKNNSGASHCVCLIGCTLDLVEDVAKRLRQLDEDDVQLPIGSSSRDVLVNRLEEEVRLHKADEQCICERLKNC